MFFIKNGIEGYRKAFCFRGIASRKTYFFFALFELLVYGVIAVASFYLNAILLDSNIQSAPVSLIMAVAGFFIILMLTVYTWLAGLAFSVRRLHDAGLSGWILLILVVIASALEFVWPVSGYIFQAVSGLGIMLIKPRVADNKFLVT